MAIKIEIEAASAAEMHEELKTLLFGTGGGVPVQLIVDGKTEVPTEKPGIFDGAVKSEDFKIGPHSKPIDEPVEEQPKKKRRTKAEIEAEKKAQEKPETEQPEPEEPATEKAPETEEEPEKTTEKKAAKIYDVNDLRQLAVSKGTPKKPGIANILKKYGVQTFPQLSSEDMQKVYAEIEVL